MVHGVAGIRDGPSVFWTSLELISIKYYFVFCLSGLSSHTDRHNGPQDVGPYHVLFFSKLNEGYKWQDV